MTSLSGPAQMRSLPRRPLITSFPLRPAVPPAELEAVFDRIAAGEAAPTAQTVADAIKRLELEPRMAALIRARIEVSMGHPADDLRAEVLGEGAATFGDFDSYSVRGGNAE